MRAPTEIRCDRSRERPDHRARSLYGEITQTATLQHARNAFRCRAGLVLLAVDRCLVILHLVDERLLCLDLIFHRKPCLTRLLLERLLCRAILLELLLECAHCIALVEHLMYEIIVLLDDALEEIHARQEVRKILCTKEYIDV